MKAAEEKKAAAAKEWRSAAKRAEQWGLPAARGLDAVDELVSSLDRGDDAVEAALGAGQKSSRDEGAADAVHRARSRRRGDEKQPSTVVRSARRRRHRRTDRQPRPRDSAHPAPRRYYRYKEGRRTRRPSGSSARERTRLALVREGAQDGAVVDVEELDGLVGRAGERVLVVGQRHEGVTALGVQLERCSRGCRRGATRGRCCRPSR